MNCSKKKILYLAVNCSYSHSSLAYGQLRCISDKYAPDWEWNMLECTVKDNMNSIISSILKNDPSIIISTLYLFNRNFVLDIIRKIKVICPVVKIIIGGPETLGNNEKLLRQYPEISTLFRGDESSLPGYLNLISDDVVSSDSYENISGLCFIDDNDSYIDNGIALLNDKLESLPSPYVSGYFNKNKPFVHFETSRGCPSKCSFCTSSILKSVQFYSLERVRADLRLLRESGIREIRVLDRTFNLPVQRAVDLLKMFSEEFSDMKFHLEFNPAKINQKIIEQLRKAIPGQLHIETGIQTFSDSSLKAVNRKIIGNAAKEGLIQLVQLPNIEIHADLIFGLPKQVKLSVFNDLEELIKIGPEEIQIETLKILPGTEINSCTELISSPVPPYEVLFTEKLCFDEILQFTYLSKIIDSYYNVRQMRSLFQFAVIHDVSFLEKFLLFAVNKFKGQDKPSFSSRFKILFDYSQQKSESELLYFVVLFSYFVSGYFQSPIDNVKLVKKDELSAILVEKPKLIWSDGLNVIHKPAYTASFDYNVADLWLDPCATQVKGKFSYLFMFSQGGMSRKVSELYLLNT